MIYSNSLVEVIKAKILFGWRIKVIVRIPFITDKFSIFSWTDGITLYDFHSTDDRKHLFPLYEGRIRKQPYSAYMNWKRKGIWTEQER